MNNPITNKKKYFKGLNGIRAVAAIGVVMGHTASMLNQFPRYAVTMFFTLSGFLITYLLITEKEQANSVDLRKFYMRRILRIWPLYFFYLLVVLGTHLFVIKDGIANAKYLGYFLVFFQNIPICYLNVAPNDMAHLWSIGTEEQFYLFWPFILLHVQNKKKFLLLLIVVTLVIRTLCGFYRLKTGNVALFYLVESLRFDCMAVGSLFAIFYFENNAMLLHFCRSAIVPILFWSLVFLISFYNLSFLSIYLNNIVTIVTGAFIINQITNKSERTLLENTPMVFLGKISYGIYIYHPLLISLSLFFFNIYGVSPRHRFLLPVVIIATILISYLSYTFLEKPFLRKKKNYTVVR